MIIFVLHLDIFNFRFFFFFQDPLLFGVFPFFGPFFCRKIPSDKGSVVSLSFLAFIVTLVSGLAKVIVLLHLSIVFLYVA
ncbi:hypothetical protein BDW59DRAFT_51310 [Aspergillus cavernicola]|uniref:Uncharacterized protein n=1 Tax=Aspergillus cavernicola TaxID=176166 RepID=A0ABR4IKB8_9EURO